MIVTPVAAPTPQSTDSSAHSPSAIERAKAAFAGVTMSRSDTPEDPEITKKRNSIRTLKMKTQVSPEQYLQEAKSQENAISPTDGQTNATIEETKPLSPQFAELARQKRALQVKERELLAKENAFNSQAPKTDASELINRLKAEPLSVLQEAGVTYEQLTEAILANPVNPELQALRDELKSVKDEVNKNFTERDTQTRQQVLSEMRLEASELVKADDFGMVREKNKVPDVLRLIERTFDETGDVLDVREAMSLIETELRRIARREAELISKYQPAPPAPLPQQPQRLMRTLTNRDTATPPMSKKARAIAAFIGTLKK